MDFAAAQPALLVVEGISRLWYTVKPVWEIGTTWELRAATLVPMPIQYIEVDLRNKTTYEFRSFSQSLGCP